MHSALTMLVVVGLTLTAAACEDAQGAPVGAVPDTPIPEGNATTSPLAGSRCDEGAAVVGFDAQGKILCAPLVEMQPTPSATPAEDSTPPSIAAFDFQPKSISLPSSSAHVTFTARIVDDLSGNAAGEGSAGALPGENGPSTKARFTSPSGVQGLFVLLGHAQRVSGDARDGVYEYTMTIPDYVEPGDWLLEQLILTDQAGNSRSLAKDEVAALGLPTTLVIQAPR